MEISKLSSWPRVKKDPRAEKYFTIMNFKTFHYIAKEDFKKRTTNIINSEDHSPNAMLPSYIQDPVKALCVSVW